MESTNPRKKKLSSKGKSPQCTTTTAIPGTNLSEPGPVNKNVQKRNEECTEDVSRPRNRPMPRPSLPFSGVSVNVKKPRKVYDSSRMNSALADVNINGMSVRKAARTWNVPRTTLNDIKRCRYSSESRPGPKTVLSHDEENHLVEWLLELARRAVLISKDNLLNSIQGILRDDPRSNPFTDNRPGNSW